MFGGDVDQAGHRYEYFHRAEQCSGQWRRLFTGRQRNNVSSTDVSVERVAACSASLSPPVRMGLASLRYQSQYSFQVNSYNAFVARSIRLRGRYRLPVGGCAAGLGCGMAGGTKRQPGSHRFRSATRIAVVMRREFCVALNQATFHGFGHHALCVKA